MAHLLADLRFWLAVLVLVLSVQSVMLFGRMFRREPPGFMWRTFMDDRGVPNAQHVALFWSICIMTVTMSVGWLTGHWPPSYVWLSWDAVALGCLFGSSYATHRYYKAGGSTEPMEPIEEKEGADGDWSPEETEHSA